MIISRNSKGPRVETAGPLGITSG